MPAAVTVKFAVVEPAATATEAGAVSRPLLLVNPMTAPPAGALCESVTTQVLFAPAINAVGVQPSESSAGALSVPPDTVVNVSRFAPASAPVARTI